MNVVKYFLSCISEIVTCASRFHVSSYRSATQCVVSLLPLSCCSRTTLTYWLADRRLTSLYQFVDLTAQTAERWSWPFMSHYSLLMGLQLHFLRSLSDLYWNAMPPSISVSWLCLMTGYEELWKEHKLFEDSS